MKKFNTKKNINILMVGVGGQGVVLGSEIFASVAMKAGFDVKKSEVHGMAQRGGSVNSHIIMGKEVFSPIIKKGTVDILLSSEELETARYTSYLNKDSIILVNKQKIYPTSVLVGKEKYPDDIIPTLKKEYKNLFLIDGLKIASDSGNIKSLSVVMLGFLASFLFIDEKIWLKELKNMLPAKILKINEKSFKEGFLEGKRIMV